MMFLAPPGPGASRGCRPEEATAPDLELAEAAVQDKELVVVAAPDHELAEAAALEARRSQRMRPTACCDAATLLASKISARCRLRPRVRPAVPPAIRSSPFIATR
jgi:hypothetical protein